MDALAAWLRDLGLERYAPVFDENDVDLEALSLLSDSELERLGVSLGHRKKLLKALADLNGDSSTAAASRIQGESLSSQAERRQLTVMFCDLAGSTALAERLDPEELRDLMQAYQQACGEVIASYQGHVAQYLGDGLMVYFGWPSAHEDDAARAIRAGLEAVEAVSKLTSWMPVQARVGIHTGLVVVGETGQGDASIPKAAVGETPNIASRLQGLAAPGCVVVSESSRLLARGLFDYADLGAHVLKGVTEPVRLFRVSAARAIDSRFEAARSEVALTPLVGREEEVALLVRRWEQAREGEGQVVLVGGEAGIGKSRLTRALRERLGEDRHVVRHHQCSPYHLNSALYPVIEQFERVAEFAREDTPEQKLDKLHAVLAGDEAVIAESVPLLAAMLSLPVDRYPPLRLSPVQQKEKTLEALAGQIEALAQRQPLLLIYEDVHWIDATSQEALDLLVPRLRDLRVLMIVTCRPEYAPRWSHQAHVTALGLNRLGRRQATELVAKVVGGKTLPQEVLAQIVARTDGVPLFVEELTRSVLESGLLREAADEYALHAPLPPLAIPTSLRDSLLARLDRLGPVKEVAQIGACIGREVSYELLARVSAQNRDQLEAAVKKLVETGLVHRRGMPPAATFIFKHALVQDAAYDSLLKVRRAQLHAQIARVLESNFPERVASEPALLAHHLTEAGDLAAAIPVLRKAGELALARVALQEAAGHFQKGLALIVRLPASAERDELELSIREPFTFAWTGLRGYAASEVAANAAAILQLARSQGKPQSLLMGLYGIWLTTFTQGRIAEALEWAQRLSAEGDRAQEIALQISGRAAAMSSRFYLGELLEAREQGNQVLALYDPQRAGRWMQLTGVDLRTSVGVYSANWTWMLGYPDQAVKAIEETDAHARRMGHPFNLAWALFYSAYAFDHRCEPERLLERAAEADRLAREQSLPFVYQVLAPLLEGLGRLRGGHPSEAISLLRPALESWDRVGGRIRHPYWKAALAEAHALQGDLDAAIHWIDESLEQVERPNWQERVHLPEILRLKGWMLMRQGRDEEAKRALGASIDWARQQQAKSWELRSSTTLASLMAERGQRDAALALLTPIYSWFTEGFDTKDLVTARELLETLR